MTVEYEGCICDDEEDMVCFECSFEKDVEGCKKYRKQYGAKKMYWTGVDW